MHRMLRATILITFGLFIICIINGCGDDDPSQKVVEPPQLEVDAPPDPTVKIAIDPPSGIYILPYTKFTLTFNEEVVAVTINGTPAAGSGLNWRWSAHPVLPDGSVTLTIKWTNQDGSKGFKTVGPYTVVDGQPDPPLIMDGTVWDGKADVDPVPINAGGFRFDFDVDVTGTIKLTNEAGVDLNWVATVAGQTATLTAVAGQELVNETTYKIEIDVQDGGGNKTRTTITFVTKLK